MRFTKEELKEIVNAHYPDYNVFVEPYTKILENGHTPVALGAGSWSSDAVSLLEYNNSILYGFYQVALLSDLYDETVIFKSLALLYPDSLEYHFPHFGSAVEKKTNDRQGDIYRANIENEGFISQFYIEAGSPSDFSAYTFSFVGYSIYMAR